jgi:hypothetical protein
MEKQIYKYGIETSFFSIITNDNDVKKVEYKNKPAIYLRENETTEVWWYYDNLEHRDHDYEVINDYKKRIQSTIIGSSTYVK